MKTILITGGTEGLGRELVKKLSRKDVKIIVVARRNDLPKSFANDKIRFYPVDISSREEIETLAKKLESQQIDILINNAGVWTDYDIEQLRPEQRESAIKTNLIGTINMTENFLPNMRKSACAQIVFVISSSGYLGIGGDTSSDWPSYNASKWGERGYVFALRNNQDNAKVKIGAIYPGGFNGNVFANAGWKDEDSHNQSWMMSTETVANAVLFMLNQPEDANIDELIITKHFRKGKK